MFDFFVGFFLALPVAFIIGFFIAHYYNSKSDISYDLTCIKEDLQNLQVKLANFMTRA